MNQSGNVHLNWLWFTDTARHNCLTKKSESHDILQNHTKIIATGQKRNNVQLQDCYYLFLQDTVLLQGTMYNFFVQLQDTVYNHKVKCTITDCIQASSLKWQNHNTWSKCDKASINSKLDKTNSRMAVESYSNQIVMRTLPHDLLLESAPCDEAVHIDHLLLPDAVSSIHRLSARHILKTVQHHRPRPVSGEHSSCQIVVITWSWGGQVIFC